MPAETVKLAGKWGELNTCFGLKYLVYQITSLLKVEIFRLMKMKKLFVMMLMKQRLLRI